MRVLVLVLVLLAAAKIGTQQYLASTAKNEIIIAVYRDRALSACREAARAMHLDISGAWAPTDDIRVMIGKTSLDVALWQIDNALWQARYKNPYLVLAMKEAPQPVYCEFDIAQGAASLFRM